MAFQDKKKNMIFQHLKKNRILDALIFYGSQRKWVLETIRFKWFLLTKRKKHISSMNPVIIGGCPRSGTTLLRSLIGMHPAIASPKQEYNLVVFNDNQSTLQSIFDFTCDELTYLKQINDHIRYSEEILHRYQLKTKCQQIAIKHPYHIAVIDEIFHYFPQTRFIHIIRDGRDVTCSLRTHPKRRKQENEIIELNTRNPFRWCVHRWISSINQGKKWRSSSQYMEITYENLVNEPMETMREIFDFLQLDMLNEQSLLDFYKYEQSGSHLQNIEVGNKLYQKSIGRWKKDMNENEKKIFKTIAGDLLIDLGYEDDLQW